MDIDGLFFDIDDFILESEEPIGEGQYGKVYIVNCDKDNQNYAAKIIQINEGKPLTAQEHQNLLNESLILRRLNHPAIIKFYGISFQSLTDASKFEPTIITEYMPKGSLSTIYPTLTPTKKYICLIGITNAMKYLHEQGIIHKDLKIDNILMDQNDFPRICDFGLSRCFPESLTMTMNFSTKEALGTPIYMPPELLRDDEHFGPGVDVYAFSILAYEIISNHSPYPEDLTLFRLATKVLNGERPIRLPTISEKMWKLLEVCWQEKADERPSFECIFSMLLNDLSYFLQPVDHDEVMDYVNRFNMNFNPTSDALKYACKLENVELVRSLLSLESTDVNEKFILFFVVFMVKLKLILLIFIKFF